MNNDEWKNDRKETIVKEGKWNDKWLDSKEIDVRRKEWMGERNEWEGI